MNNLNEPLLKGESLTAEQYLTRCVGYFYHGDPLNEPDKFIAYFEDELLRAQESLAAAELQLAELRDMTLAERGAYGAARWEQIRTEETGYVIRVTALAERYQALERKVADWENPPILTGLKEYAIKQLDEGRRFDTGGIDMNCLPPAGTDLWDSNLVSRRRTVERCEAQVTEALEAVQGAQALCAALELALSD